MSVVIFDDSICTLIHHVWTDIERGKKGTFVTRGKNGKTKLDRNAIKLVVKTTDDLLRAASKEGTVQFYR